MREKVEKEKAGAATAGKKETWPQKKILDLLGWGNNPSLFLRPMIKQLFNYRSKTGKKTPKQSRGRIVRVKHKNAIQGDIKGIQYHSEGIKDHTREEKGIHSGKKHPAPVITIHCSGSRGKRKDTILYITNTIKDIAYPYIKQNSTYNTFNIIQRTNIPIKL